MPKKPTGRLVFCGGMSANAQKKLGIIMSANAQKKLRPNIMKPLFGQPWSICHLPGHLTLREIYRALRLYKGEQQDLLRVIMATLVVLVTCSKIHYSGIHCIKEGQEHRY